MSTSTTFSTTTNPPRTSEQILSVQDISSSLQRFGWADYFVFVLMLMICAGIGVYFGFVEKRKKNEQKNAKERDIEDRRGSEALDYLVGGRKMKVIPVSLSLVASFVSGISLLGTSTEIYVYGTQYAFILVTIVIAGFISWYIFLPVFVNLQLTSTYEYLELRFDRRVRFMGSVLYSLSTILWLPIVIYVPALAFNQVTGVNIHIVTPVVCVICIFYTCVGGLKAVVWTDVVQTVVMVGSILVVILKGTHDVGGWRVVYERNYQSGRIEALEASLDPTIRYTYGSMLIGASIYYVQINCGNQAMMQRFLSVPTVKDAKHCLIFYSCGIICIYLMTLYNGLLIFAKYHDCDPLTTGLSKASDQLVPLLVMDVLGGVFPGLAGCFVAGVFSAALSSLSTGLNSMAAVILEDFVKPNRSVPLTEKQTALVCKSVVIIVGILCIGLVFVVEKLGMVVQLSMTLGSSSQGPLFGCFCIGFLLPWIKGKSVFIGSICSFLIMVFVCIKAQIAIAGGEIFQAKKPVTTEGCTYSFESILSQTLATNEPIKKQFYHLSYLYYCVTGCVLTIIFSLLASLKLGFNDVSLMDPNLLPSFMRKFTTSKEYLSVRPDIKERSRIIHAFEIKENLSNS